MSKVTITGMDNRGTTDVPYGYVYFSDGNRLGFGSDDSETSYGEYGLFETSWGPVGIAGYKLADEYLKARLQPTDEKIHTNMWEVRFGTDGAGLTAGYVYAETMDEARTTSAKMLTVKGFPLQSEKGLFSVHRLAFDPADATGLDKLINDLKGGN